MGKGNEVFVLNMGQQVRILDLAEDLIRLSGLAAGPGHRDRFYRHPPGRKTSEDLWDEGAVFEATGHPDIFQVRGQGVLSGDPLYQTLDELAQLAHEGDAHTAINLLDELIPGSAVRSTPPPR